MYDTSGITSIPEIGETEEITPALAYYIANKWASFYNHSIESPLGFGSWGRAYLLEDGTVLKVTTSLGEAAFAYEAIAEAPEGYVPIHSVEKVNSTIFVITMDYVDQPDFLKDLCIILDNFIEEHDILFSECPSQYEHHLEEEEVVQLYWDLHYIATNNPKFPMKDIHFGNVGLDSETGDLILIDQLFEHFSKAEYLQRIETIQLENIENVA